MTLTMLPKLSGPWFFIFKIRDRISQGITNCVLWNSQASCTWWYLAWVGLNGEKEVLICLQSLSTVALLLGFIYECVCAKFCFKEILKLND